LRFADSGRAFPALQFNRRLPSTSHFQPSSRKGNGPAMSENLEGPWLFEFEDGQSIRFAVHEAVEDRDECIELIEVRAALFFEIPHNFSVNYAG
jgi:hypothetical protein